MNHITFLYTEVRTMERRFTEALDYLIKEENTFNRDNKVGRDDIKSIMSEEFKINGRISEIA